MVINKRWKPAKREGCGWTGFKTTGLNDTVLIKSLFLSTAIIYILQLRENNGNALSINSWQHWYSHTFGDTTHQCIVCWIISIYLLSACYSVRKTRPSPPTTKKKRLMWNWIFFRTYLQKPFIEKCVNTNLFPQVRLNCSQITIICFNMPCLSDQSNLQSSFCYVNVYLRNKPLKFTSRLLERLSRRVTYTN